jgi:hypothetical protein
MFSEEYKLWSSSLCNFLHSYLTSSLSGPNILEHPQPIFFLNVSDQVAHPCETTGKYMVSYIFSRFQIEDTKTDSEQTGTKHSSSVI